MIIGSYQIQARFLRLISCTHGLGFMQILASIPLLTSLYISFCAQSYPKSLCYGSLTVRANPRVLHYAMLKFSIYLLVLHNRSRDPGSPTPSSPVCLRYTSHPMCPGYPGSPMCSGYPSSPMCPGSPGSPMCPELETLEWWISGLMLNPLFFLISRLNIACSPHEFNLQIN